MKPKEQIIKNLKGTFLRVSFFIAMGAGIIMNLIVVAGNPELFGWFDLHWIPEVIMTFFAGFWFGEIKLPAKYIAIPFLLAIFLPPLMLQNIWAILIAVPLAIPFLVGFCFQVGLMRKKNKPFYIWDDAGVCLPKGGDDNKN